MVDDVPRQLGGRYQVGELIGRGGMAEVHVGQDTRLGRRVAIKLLRSDLARDPIFQARFRREAQSAAALNHPSIVAVYDTSEDVVTTPAGASVHIPYIVMEYVEGHTVRELVRDGTALPIEEAVEIVDGVLGALEYSHHAGIVHRDIKPGNVMLTPTGGVKVMDFGIARAMADSAATMTATHAVIGTAQYLSPEQARGEVVDTRSDLYSTGCLLFELLTGRTPFVGDSPVSIAYQHVVEQPPTPSSLAGDVSERLDRVVLKALAKDRNQRYQRAAEFRADLKAAAGDQAISAPPLAVLVSSGKDAREAATASISAADGATSVIAVPGDPEPTARAAASSGGRPSPQSAPTRRRRRTWLVWLLSILGFAILAGGVWAVVQATAPSGPTLVDIPSLRDLTEREARTTLAGVGLSMTSATESSETVAEGLAIRWEPETSAPDGSIVTVYFSTGPEATAIPDVAGLTQAEARQRLSQSGFTGEVSTTTVDEPGVEKDVAVRTEPAAGEQVAPGTAIVLVLATGNVDVPDLTGLTDTEAAATLGSLKLTTVIEGERPGVVISQDRRGPIPVNATVTLTIGPAPDEPGPDGAVDDVALAQAGPDVAAELAPDIVIESE